MNQKWLAFQIPPKRKEEALLPSKTIPGPECFGCRSGESMLEAAPGDLSVMACRIDKHVSDIRVPEEDTEPVCPFFHRKE